MNFLNKSAIAFSSVLILHSAQSATKISGSSALATNIVKTLATTNFCPNNNVTVYRLSTTTNTLGEVFTVKCNSGNFGTSGENEVQFDTSGGSLGAILLSDKGSSEPKASDGNFLPASTAGCVGTNGTGSLSFLDSTKFRTCPASATLLRGKSVGGFMDVEPQIFEVNGLISGHYGQYARSTSFSHVIGVAVSQDLYEAMQNEQGLTAGIVNSTPKNQPTVSRAQISAMISSVDYNDAKFKGPNFLVPSTTQSNITHCRYPETSGTQAAANSYFLGSPGLTGQLGGMILPHDPSVANSPDEIVSTGSNGKSMTFKIVSGVSGMIRCLNAKGFAIGFLSAENNPIGTSDTYRFIKMNRIEMSEGITNATQTATAISGEYDFVFEASIFNPNNNSLLSIINESFSAGAESPGVFLNIFSTTPESNFTRNGSATGIFTSN